MAWTNLTFAYGSVLTSTKMTQLQDNFGYGAGSPAPNFTAGLTATTIAASSSILSSSPTGGVGYTTGAGGTVTQITNINTPVVLNKISGKITTVSFTAVTGSYYEFALNNTTLANGDTLSFTFGINNAVLIAHARGLVGGNACTINLYCILGGTGAVVFNFNVHRGANT